MVSPRPTAAALALLAAGCGDGVIGKMYPDPPLPAQLAVDVLLVVDDSRAADDSLATFAVQAGELARTLVAPACVVAGDHLVPAPPEGCNTNERGSIANVSVRIGVVSSALEDGASGCDARGLLVEPRSPETGAEGGEPVVLAASSGGSAEARDAFAALVRSRVLAARDERRDRESRGAFCAHAQPLEVSRRFLAEPEPTRPDGQPDLELLSARAALIRPWSTVLTFAHAPRNDCSVRREAAEALFDEGRLPCARSICSFQPDDECCAPCGAPVAVGCGVDATCEKQPFHTAASDPEALRCWEPRRRFGLDALEDTERYSRAFSSPILEDGTPNELFRGGRLPAHVLFVPITGVPWQDLGAQGLSLTRGTLGPPSWGHLLGEGGQPPSDVHMLESRAPRLGLLPPGSFPTDPKSGAEHAFPEQLQYACVFPLVEPRDCSPPASGEIPEDTASCSCGMGAPASPLCDLGQPALQISGAATPGGRLVEVVQLLGPTAGVGSSCAPSVAAAPEDSAGRLGQQGDLGRLAAGWALGVLSR